METDTAATSKTQTADRDALVEEVASFLRTNVPQIAMHGGSAAIQALDPDSGEVWIRLSGTCGGCGISPMTTRAIQSRIPLDIDGITAVHIETA